MQAGDMTILIIIGIILMCGIISIIKSLKECFDNNRQPETSTEVRISRVKRKKSHSKNRLNLNPQYIVTFLFPNSEYKEFYIPQYRHEWIRDGDTVILTHQGTRFIKLERKSDD